MEIEIESVHKDFQLMELATEHSAAFDVRCMSDEPVMVMPGQTRLIPLGFKMKMPDGYVAMLLPRSGLGHKRGIVLGNLVGLIDPDYPEQVFASVWNRNNGGGGFEILPGDRIAQMMFVKVETPTFKMKKVKQTTSRKGGLGHTGKE